MLEGLCEPLLVRLVQALKVVDFVPGQLMLEKGRESEGLRWIWTGTFEVLDCFEGVYSVSTLSEGMMLGENCFVRNSPRNYCNVRAMTWCNVVMLPMAEVANVFEGYDRDAYWMMCFAEVRWPRFCAAVALSNVLEYASRHGTSLKSWIQVCLWTYQVLCLRPR